MSHQWVASQGGARCARCGGWQRSIGGRGCREAGDYTPDTVPNQTHQADGPLAGGMVHHDASPMRELLDWFRRRRDR